MSAALHDHIAVLFSEFAAAFPTEESCVAELLRCAKEEDLLKCHHCGSADFENSDGGRVLNCLACGGDTWFTSGTLFDRARRLRPWLAAIWLMERGVLLSSSRLHKLIDIAQSSALTLLRKIRTAIETDMADIVTTAPSG